MTDDERRGKDTLRTPLLTSRFARNLRRQRVLAGLSQGQLAAAVGVTAAYVAQLEAGAAPSMRVASELGQALGLDPAVLFG